MYGCSCSYPYKSSISNISHFNVAHSRGKKPGYVWKGDIQRQMKAIKGKGHFFLNEFELLSKTPDTNKTEKSYQKSTSKVRERSKDEKKKKKKEKMKAPQHRAGIYFLGKRSTWNFWSNIFKEV